MPRPANQTQADNYTKVAMATEAISIIGDTYWLGLVLDYLFKNKEDVIGLSRYAITFAIVIAAFSTAGSVYSHRAVNCHTQKTDASPQESQPESDTRLLPNGVTVLTQLSWLQKIMLGGNLFARAIDIASPLGLVYKMAKGNADVPRYIELMLNFLFLLFGALSGLADTRSCKKAMQKTAVEEQGGRDILSGVAAVGEITGLLSDVYFFSRFFGVLFFIEKEKTVLGVSVYTLPIGTIIGILATAGSAWSHWNLNQYFRNHKGSEPTSDEQEQQALHCKHKLALAGDWIAHASDFAGPLTFVVRIATANKPPSHIVELLVNAGLFGVGMTGSAADVRACRRAMENTSCRA